MTEDDSLRLDWDDYRESMTESLKSLVQDQEFVDVVLHTEGRTLKAHRVFLSACSLYFSTVLRGTKPWQQPILFLPNIPYKDLEKILDFVYHGSVEVSRSSLASFLYSASILQINGLVDKQNLDNVGLIDNSQVSSPAFKKKKIDSTDEPNKSNLNIDNTIVKQEIEDTATENMSASEQVVVKADPEDFQRRSEEEQVHREGRNLAIRSDLVSRIEGGRRSDPGDEIFCERGRCHFCSLLCSSRSALTEHLKDVHQPPKHSLCENCENFFHICAIQRHRLKCKARYQTDVRSAIFEKTKLLDKCP